MSNDIPVQFNMYIYISIFYMSNDIPLQSSMYIYILNVI